MFGDVGHGLLMLIPALLLCAMYSKIRRIKLPEPLPMMLRARWLLLLMAIGAIYVGFLYNEFFAIPMNFGMSQWEPKANSQFWTQKPGAPVFPFGVDPAWKGIRNKEYVVVCAEY